MQQHKKHRFRLPEGSKDQRQATYREELEPLDSTLQHTHANTGKQGKGYPSASWYLWSSSQRWL